MSFIYCRVLYYMNYLAEEEYVVADGATRTFNIAPGCTGSRAGGRCTFAEFMLYTWTGVANQVPVEANRPTGYDPATWNAILDSPEDHSVADLANALTSVHTNKLTKKGGPSFITGFTWPDSLWPSTPAGDYFTIMAQMGEKLNQLKVSLGTSPPTELQSKILSLGKDAAQSVVELRFQVFEKSRLPALEATLGYKPSTKTYTIGAGFGTDFEVLDVVKNEIDHPGSTAAVNKAVTDYATSSKSAVSHLSAIESAKTGGMGIGCAFVPEF
jgi:hypothetical protein